MLLGLLFLPKNLDMSVCVCRYTFILILINIKCDISKNSNIKKRMIQYEYQTKLLDQMSPNISLSQ